MENQKPQPPHVVFLPFPALGHIKPMLKLAELLSHAGLQVTFINTQHIHHLLLPSIDTDALYRRFPNFNFLSIPDGLPPHHPRTFLNIFPSISSATVTALCHMLVSDLSCTTTTCIIADGIMSSSVVTAGEEFGIPVLAFRTFSACCTWANFHLSKLIEEGEVPLQDMDKLVTCIPGLENVLRCRDLPGICRVERAEDPILEFFINEAKAMLRASALILNTFDELEAPIISKLSSLFPKIYTIGPLHALSNVRINVNDDPSPLASSSTSILWKEDKDCITWLHSQPSKSVVFASLGSIASLTQEQILEFWHGLVDSGKSFLLVIRPDLIIGEDSSGNSAQLLTDLQERTKGKGMIVSWAPQEQVLSHPAVGGFLTHGGWNSILESTHAGVPMICWPVISDQQVNSRFVSEVWRVGLDMKDRCERGVVEKMVRDLMEVKRDEIMKVMDGVAEQARKSVEEGGSSYRNLELLIQEIRSMTTLI
ncbi:UDP-glucosyl transferase 85A3, putative isoform 2 [Hibiscus syriacus]|uniref:UDP-glucosyl transferase 85A3, putative isoform 2 n=1 Tax=Hibiscus syriacus TaxID=106335 RepID=A0A6A2WQY1_HIBSY|nr:7-deoxyloganetic acid glucosyl transferase-like [Hibiscus syriacus]KAE8663028.1 UDP-glucosyl transferase 85A3, putative isoform 2 [Hibiscus syriacus]